MRFDEKLDLFKRLQKYKYIRKISDIGDISKATAPKQTWTWYSDLKR